MNKYSITKEIEGRKKCKVCGVEKPLVDFAINKRGKNGTHNFCKDCGNKKITKVTLDALKNGFKKCNKCGEIKLLEFFSKNQNNFHTFCKVCRLKSAKKIYQEDREKFLNKRKAYRDAFPDKVCEQKKRHYYNNKEVYYAANKRRRDKKKLACETVLNVKHIKLVKELFNQECFNCGSRNKLVLDHNLPLHEGYPLCLGNCVLLCQFCNGSKWNKMPELFYSEDKMIVLNKILKEQENYVES